MHLRGAALMLVGSVLAVMGFGPAAAAGTVDDPSVALSALASQTSGTLGACIGSSAADLACVNPDRPMPMQSVMKLLVAIAVLDAADRGRWSLDDPVTVYPRDLSLFVQPIAKLVTEKGYRTTIGDLVRRSIIDSDCAAADILIRRLGGTSVVQSVLASRGVTGIRIDRDERQLQTEILGLGGWKPEYADPAKLSAAIAGVPDEVRDRAWARYRADQRDTATPRAMTLLLIRLDEGELLSRRSTSFLMKAMLETRTFPMRLPAGIPDGWQVLHKSGTSSTWKGLTAATNDVGVLISPKHQAIAVSAFLADSMAPDAERDAALSKVAAIAVHEQGPPSPASPLQRNIIAA